jgi:DNA-binding transcriptional MerR regulator
METGVADKLYFRIGEVAELTSLNPSVLRYWETEFEMLVPVKSRSGQRLYTKSDIDLIKEIKILLHTDRLTIAGARKRINERRKKHIFEDLADRQTRIIADVKDDLRRFRALLEQGI